MTEVEVQMGKPIFCPTEIPVLFSGDRMIGQSIEVDGQQYFVTCLSMGNPHCVLFYEDVDSLDLPAMGSCFEHNAFFPEGVNTEFIQIRNERLLKMRVWERGSGETWSCGTGACAAVVAAVENGYCRKDVPVEVLLRGGKLSIRYSEDTVWMRGAAEKVFTGKIEVEITSGI